MDMSPLPVYMRIGDGPECLVGTVTPETKELVRLPDGSASVTLTVPLPEFLRGAADVMEGISDGQ
jgi:hypothetical protein